MADDVLASFMVALGFRVDQGSQKAATKSVKDYEAAVVAAEEAIEKARWDGAKTEEEVARLTRETNLKLAKEALEKAKQVEREQKRATRAFAENQKKQNKAQAEATAFAIAKFQLLITAIQDTARAVSGSLTSTVTGFNQLYYVSGRTGASVSNLKALGYAFEQTGSSASDAISAVETFTQAMRSNPGVRGFVDGLGVDKNLDGVEKLIAVVDKLNATRKPEIAQAQATGILGLSVAQYNQLTFQGAEIKKRLQERRDFLKAVGTDEKEASEASNRFSQSLGSVVMMAGVLRDKLVIALIPAVEGLVKRFEEWIRQNPKKIDEIITSIAKGITDFVKAAGKVNWEELFRGLIEFAKGANSAAQAMGGWKVVAEALFALWIGDKVVKVLASIAAIRSALVLGEGSLLAALLRIAAPIAIGAAATGHGYQTPEDYKKSLEADPEARAFDEDQKARARARRDDPRRWYEKILPKAWGGKDAPEGLGREGVYRRAERARRRRGAAEPGDERGGAGSTAPIAGQTFREKAPGVMRRLMQDFDLNKEEAAVVLGNLGHESAGFRAFEEGGHGPGRGWAQWTDPGRKRRFFEYAEKNQLDPRSDEANYGFLRWELRNTHRSAIERLKQAQGRDAKMFQFEDAFEGARVKAYGSRNRYANEAERAFDAAERRGAPVAPPASAIRGLPNLTPGGFDPNRIDPKDLMRPAPAGASPVTNNNTSSTSRAVTQNITNNVRVDGSRDPREHGRVMESSLSRVHGLALANAQTAVV